MSKEEQKDQVKDPPASAASQFDTETRPVDELDSTPGIYVCTVCGLWFVYGDEARVHRDEFDHEECWMRRPKPPYDGWQDPFVIEANPALKEQGLVKNNSSSGKNRRKKLKQDMT